MTTLDFSEIQSTQFEPERWGHRYSFNQAYLQKVRRKRKQRNIRYKLKKNPVKQDDKASEIRVDTFKENPEQWVNMKQAAETNAALLEPSSLAQQWVMDAGVADIAENKILLSETNMVDAVKRSNNNYKASLDRFVPQSSVGKQDIAYQRTRNMQSANRMLTNRQKIMMRGSTLRSQQKAQMQYEEMRGI